MSKSSELAKLHEACRLEPYRDTVGVLTIGWGTNIERISQEEADWLFEHRWQKVLAECAKFPWFDNEFGEVRQAVIENMVYNLGLSRFMGFKKTIAYLEARDYEKASFEMLDSKWAKQVGYRAHELSNMMRTGQWPA